MEKTAPPLSVHTERTNLQEPIKVLIVPKEVKVIRLRRVVLRNRPAGKLLNN